MSTRLLIDSAWTLGTRIALRGANFLAFLVLARALSVQDFGFYGWVAATTTVLSVAFDLGLRQSTAYLAGHEPGRRAAAITHTLAMALGLGALAAVATWAALRGAGYASTYGDLAVLAAVNAWPMLVLRTGQGAFLGGGQLVRLNATELVSRVVLLAGTVGLYLAGALDLAASLWVLLAAHLAAGGWLLIQLRGDITPRTLVDGALIRELLARGATFAAGILLLLVMGRVGIWIVGAQLGDTALGLWFGVQRLGEMLVEVATAVGMVLFSHGIRAADPEQGARDAVRVARLVTTVMVVIALVVGVAAGPFLSLFLGPAYAVEATAFRSVMLGTVAACFNAMLYPTLGSLGLARWGVAAYAVGCSAAAVATLTLLPPLGLTGAAVAYAGSQVLVTAVLLVAYRRRFGLRVATILLPQREDAAVVAKLVRRARGLEAEAGKRYKS